MTAQPVLRGVTDHGAPVTLRPAEVRDIDAIYETCRDEESMRYTSIPPDYSLERAAGFVDDYAPGFWARGEGAVWVIADENDAYVGQIDLRVNPKDKQVADVGFVMSPRARGKGYMTAALRAAVRFGFAELGLERIEWSAHVGNDASKRVAEKAGFQLEGIHRKGVAHGDTRYDSWIAAIIREDLA